MSNIKSIDISELIPASLAAISIISGVVLKNTSEQDPTGSFKMLGEYVGPALFLGGWALLLYVLIRGLGLGLEMLQYILSVAMIAGAVMHVKMSDSPNPIIGLLFPLGWLLLGYTLSFGSIMDIAEVPSLLLSQRTMLSLGATLLVLLSMIFILPWQRDNCVIDGPGMPMFTIAWGMIIYALST